MSYRVLKFSSRCGRLIILSGPSCVGKGPLHTAFSNLGDPTGDTFAELDLRRPDRRLRAGRLKCNRDTCTETPEKTYALANSYFRETGKLLLLTWDFSHIAVVKHLTPDDEIILSLGEVKLVNRKIAAARNSRAFHQSKADRRARTRGLGEWLPL